MKGNYPTKKHLTAARPMSSFLNCFSFLLTARSLAASSSRSLDLVCLTMSTRAAETLARSSRCAASCAAAIWALSLALSLLFSRMSVCLSARSCIARFAFAASARDAACSCRVQRKGKHPMQQTPQTRFENIRSSYDNIASRQYKILIHREK